jgi:hypothetical protein
MAGDQEYGRLLGQVLRQRDVPALRAFLQEQAARYGDERQVEAIRNQTDSELELILHRMILSRPDLGDLHAESERRLTAAGASTGRQPRRGQGRQPGKTPPGRHAPNARRRAPGPPGADGQTERRRP